MPVDNVSFLIELKKLISYRCLVSLSFLIRQDFLDLVFVALLESPELFMLASLEIEKRHTFREGIITVFAFQEVVMIVPCRDLKMELFVGVSFVRHLLFNDQSFQRPVFNMSAILIEINEIRTIVVHLAGIIGKPVAKGIRNFPIAVVSLNLFQLIENAGIEVRHNVVLIFLPPIYDKDSIFVSCVR